MFLLSIVWLRILPDGGYIHSVCLAHNIFVQPTPPFSLVCGFCFCPNCLADNLCGHHSLLICVCVFFAKFLSKLLGAQFVWAVHTFMHYISSKYCQLVKFNQVICGTPYFTMYIHSVEVFDWLYVYGKATLSLVIIGVKCTMQTAMLLVIMLFRQYLFIHMSMRLIWITSVHSCKKCFCLREPVFWGRIFLILRRNFPNME